MTISFFAIKDNKWGDHIQTFNSDNAEITSGHQPFRLIYDQERQGYKVMMQGIAYVNPNTNKSFTFPAIIEDWEEVTFIPNYNYAEADKQKCSKEEFEKYPEIGSLPPEHEYEMHTERHFNFRAKGTDCK